MFSRFSRESQYSGSGGGPVIEDTSMKSIPLGGDGTGLVIGEELVDSLKRTSVLLLESKGNLSRKSC
jgi:hypothetical protein